MPAPKDSFLKVDWARRDFNALDHLVRSFLDAHPYALRVEKKPQPRKYALLAKSTPCPSDWGLMIGDIANNARCALDYIVAGVSAATTKKDRRGLCFPILDIESDFHGGKARWLSGVDQPLINLIESFQPYKGGGSGNPLALLQDINNGDKHHAIRTVSAVGQNAGVSLGAGFNAPPGAIRIENSSVTIHGVGLQVFKGEITEQEREIVEFTTKDDRPIGFHPHIAPEIHFAKGQSGIEGRAVIPTLRVILDRVEEVVRHFP